VSSVILSTLRDLARTLGCGDHQAEAVVREERSARAAMSRRGLFKAAGAVAAGVVLAEFAPAPESMLTNLDGWIARDQSLLGSYAPPTIDGIPLRSGYLLVYRQTQSRQNGIYRMSVGGNWERLQQEASE
jgi:hypothetical protein